MQETGGLTPFAWMFMLVSMGAVTFLTVYCFWRILRTPRDSGGGGQVGTTGERPLET